MAVLANRVKVNTATLGTGTVTLGAVSSNAFCTFAEAGITDGQTVAYCIEEGVDFEIGTGVYTSAGTTMTRATVTLSKIGGASGTTKMTLAGAATVRIVARKEDIFNVADPLSAAQAAVQADLETGTSTTLAVTPGTAHFHPSSVKFWVKWGVTTTISVSYNTTSITDTGAGDWTVNIGNDFSSANWAALYTAQSGTTAPAAIFPTTGTMAAGTVRCFTCDGSAVKGDDVNNHCAGLGDL
jgi:hypothetical protein